MNDPGAGWNHVEVLETALGPLQELVALLVPLNLHRHVAREGFFRAECVDLNGMVDDEVDAHLRVDPLHIASEAHDG